MNITIGLHKQRNVIRIFLFFFNSIDKPQQFVHIVFLYLDEANIIECHNDLEHLPAPGPPKTNITLGFDVAMIQLLMNI